MIETRGMMSKNVPSLERCSVLFRKLYFYRRSLVTLMEIRSVLEELHRLDQFKDLLSRQTQSDKNKLQNMIAEIRNAHSLVKTMRNKFGGHILLKDVKKALEDMPVYSEGYIAVGRRLNQTHYRFAGEFVVEMMLEGVHGSPVRKAKIQRDFSAIGKVIPVLGLLDDIVTWYAVDRSLV